MRIIIIGSTGFIGRNLVEKLGTRHEIYSVIRGSSVDKNRSLIDEFMRKGVYVDILNKLSVDDLVNYFKNNSSDVIIFAAGLLKGSWSDLKEVHADLPSRILDAMNLSGLKETLFVYISSTGASKPGIDPVVEEDTHCEHMNSLRSGYERSKCLGEKIVRERSFRYGINHVILRPSIVVGEYNTHNEWITLMRLARRGVKIDINFVFNIIDIDDLVGVIDKIIGGKDLYNNYYHVASPKPISMKRVTDILFDVLGKKPIVRVGDRILYLAKILRFIAPSDVTRSFLETIVKKRYIVSVKKLLSKLDHVFIDPEETFKRYFTWLTTQYSL